MKTAVVMGKGSLAIKGASWFLQSGSYELRAVVPSVPPPEWAESLPAWARSRSVDVVESGRYEELVEVLDVWPPDLVMSIFYSRIVGREFLDECPRVLNLHNSPLPKYRGVAPINWALKNGEDEHGVTIHEMVPEVDAGPIVGQVTFSIYPSVDEVIDVYQRCLRYGWVLFRETLPRLEDVEAVPQDKTEATYYSSEDKEALGERRDFARPTRLSSGEVDLSQYPIGSL